MRNKTPLSRKVAITRRSSLSVLEREESLARCTTRPMMRDVTMTLVHRGSRLPDIMSMQLWVTLIGKRTSKVQSPKCSTSVPWKTGGPRFLIDPKDVYVNWKSRDDPCNWTSMVILWKSKFRYQEILTWSALAKPWRGEFVERPYRSATNDTATSSLR